MKKVLFIFIIFCSCLYVKAQVSFGSANKVKINLITEKDSTFLTLFLKSEKLKISDSPKMLLRLMDDSVISLDGYMLGATNKSEGAVMIGYMAVAINHYVTEAKFPITKDQVESLSKGVKKLRLNTSPKLYEKEWNKDKIGIKLYKKYQESSSNSFEDGF